MTQIIKNWDAEGYREFPTMASVTTVNVLNKYSMSLFIRETQVKMVQDSFLY